MLCNFRKTFKPTEEEKRERWEKAIQATKEGIKNRECWVCQHFFYDTRVPSVVEYRGECSKGLLIDCLRPNGSVCKEWAVNRHSPFVADLISRGYSFPNHDSVKGDLIT